MSTQNRNKYLRVGRIILILAALPFIRFSAWRMEGGTAWAATETSSGPSGASSEAPGAKRTQVVITGGKISFVCDAGGNTSKTIGGKAVSLAYPLSEGHYCVPWGDLSGFPYATPGIESEIDPKYGETLKKKYRIPGFIQNLNDIKVAVVGFLIPLDLDASGRKALSFILAKSQATCCYGIAPKMNEWIYVKMEPGRSTEPVMDVPVTVFGSLEVGEARGKNEGWSLYRMVSSKVTFPKESFW